MADENQLSILRQGATVWNQWRADRTIPILVDLRGADFGGKELSGVNLRGADLEGTSFREANLSNADLRDSRGLRTGQVAGTDLTGAKLPEQLTKLYEGLQNVKDISESARKLFLVVLGACLYCWLTIATTTDVNLITNRNASALPIIQTSIPIVGFYVVGPVLVLCVYFYFQFYLQKLWEELGSLPAIFPDGRPLHTKVDPWLLNDLVRSHLCKLNADRPFLSYFQLWISLLLAWWVVPVTMFLFWGRYLRRHDRIGTILHVTLLTVSLVAAISLYRLAVATLRGIPRMPFTWKDGSMGHRGYRVALLGVVIGVLFGVISAGAVWGVSSDQWSKNPRTWVPSAMDLIGYSAFLDIRSADVSEKKPNWNPESEKESVEGSVTGAQLDGAHLRFASAQGAFMAGADLDGADLRDAYLMGADLRGALLVGADLVGTDLVGTDMTNADLNGANLSGARLSKSDLTDTVLRGADLSGAVLSGAVLNNADLLGADLRDADLNYCDLRRVRNLDPLKAKGGRNWESAYYDEALFKTLGLSPDHNEQLDVRRKKEGSS